MSVTQVMVIALIVAAFALGWWGHGWRRGAESSPPETATLDASLRATLTAFQAALSVWQAQPPDATGPGALARQALAAFEREHAAVAAFELPRSAPPELAATLRRARRATDRLSAGLSPLTSGVPLDRDRERSLAGAERALIAARYELLAHRRRA